MQLPQILRAITNVILSIIALFLGFRLILKLFGANPEAEFVAWIYETSQPLLAPFEQIFPTARIDGTFVLEFSTLFALLVYGLVGAVVLSGIDALENPRTRRR